jgi:hypothetical protein
LFTTLLEAGRKKGGTFVPLHHVGRKKMNAPFSLKGAFLLMRI